MLYLYRKRWSMVMLLLITLTSLLAVRPAAAAPNVDGRFGEFWQEHGGLPIFGFAISGQAFERNSDAGRSYLTQWFERNRFELHEENARPYDVLLGRLGADRLRQLGRNWQAFPKASPYAAHYFAETGHAIAHGPFWSYWSSHGLEFDGRYGTSFDESLALFGLPLSEPAMEINTSGDRVLTQWFERARFEDHGAKGVLLGLLGSEVHGSAAPQPPVARLKYFWPRTSPLTVWYQGGSYADERGFELQLAWPHSREADVVISGGDAVSPPEGTGRALTIRGQAGTAYVSATRMAVVWMEDGKRYMIHGTLRQHEILALADDFEVLDLATFRARLQRPEPPAPRLKYFWPRTSPLAVWHMGGSYADERGFALHLAGPHAAEPDATISGGAIVPPDGRGERVVVRGQQGDLYSVGSRRALVWVEEGQRYMIYGSLRASELVMLADDLEAVDLATFRGRLQRSQPPAGGLKYLWPRTSPLTVWHQGGSYADERSFVLHLALPHATEPDATISGGAIAPPPEGRGIDVTVRGQRGTLHTLGTRLALAWTEGGEFYMIYSKLPQRDLMALADDLEALDLATFRGRLQQPAARLKYFWPGPDLHELSVLPEPYGGSFADERSFKLNLYRVHSTQPNVTIWGGTIVELPQRTGQGVAVRGLPGTAYAGSLGYTLAWTEEGNRYMITSDMTLPDILDLADTLQVVSLATFRARIQP